MITRQRFELALERIKSSDWARFEELASQFLSIEFNSLRTVAAMSGDGGRDSELFSPEGKAKVLIQYSVTEYWKSKINQTAKRIKEKFPDAVILIYTTNQLIGAKADSLKNDLLTRKNFILDIRDKTWFLDRTSISEAHEIAAERLAEEYVDSLLKDRGIVECSSSVLSEIENRAAYLYLTLQFEDESRDKGLTKLCYESLIKSILRETDSNNRISRKEIKKRICNILTSHSEKYVKLLTDNALKRMTKRTIRHWKEQDEFCLSHQEIIRLSTELAKHEKLRKFLLKYIKNLVQTISGEKYKELTKTNDKFEIHIVSILQQYLSNRGEKFALSVSTGKMPGLAVNDLKDVIIQHIAESSFVKESKLKVDIVQIIIDTIHSLFQSPPNEISIYLRSISDSYTLMAFLRETPDVQASVKKLFSNGTIWLDTSIVLPLLAETLIEDAANRQYTNMLRSAQKTGLTLRIIRGIVEEINGHINRCLACARTPSTGWQGDIPFLFSLYVQNGRQISQFSNWSETFKGGQKPEDDLIDYLRDFHEIEIESLENDAYSVDMALRGSVQEIWRDSHEYRSKRKGYEIDNMIIGKLISHDVENYLGVVKRREKDTNTPLGFSAWWLTLDSTAHMLESLIHNRIQGKVPSSPVMSLDYFANYLSIGPLRKVRGETNFSLPIFIDRNFSGHIPKELLDMATKVREESKDLPEHVIRRKVRDELEKAKRRPGKHVEGGTDLIKENIEQAFEEDTLEI